MANSDLVTRAYFLANGLERVNDMRRREDSSCPICFRVSQTPVKTSCGHVYCSECADHWFQSSHTCPDCRQPLFDPETLPPQLPADVEPLDLDFVVDHAKVVDAFHGFGESIDQMEEEGGNLSLNGEEDVYIDNDDQLPIAVGAATCLLASNAGVDNTCRGSWIKVCNISRSFLQKWDGQVVTAEYMHGRITQAMWDGLVWSSETQRMPSYWNENNEDYGSAGSFEKDLEMFVDWMVQCAHVRMGEL